MSQLLFLTLLTVFGCCFAFTQHIDHVAVDSLPSVHQQEFISSLLNPSKRRAILEDTTDYFRLNGLYKDESTKHDFILKLAHSSDATLTVNVDGSEVDVSVAPIFHGYLVGDYHSIISLSFPSVDEGDATPVGMIHHSSGHHFSLTLSEFGVTIESLEEVPEGYEIPRPGCNSSHEHHHHDEVVEAILKQKRDVEYLASNGLAANSLPLKAIDFVVETDVAFYRTHGYNSQRAVNYILSLVAATNIFYERDIRAALVVRSIGLHSSRAPASNLDSLDAYLNANPALDRLADVALLLQGAGSGGLAYIGTVCLTSRNTGHASSRGRYGSRRWDAPEDLIMLSHEIGHILGSPHTHDPYGYNPVVDKCGSSQKGSSIPPEGGSLMSYCHLTSGSVGYTNIRFYLGYVGAFGYRSERVNQKIRATLDSRSCLSPYIKKNTVPTDSPSTVPATADATGSTPTSATPSTSRSACTDISNPNYKYKNGRPVVCSTEARLGRCNTLANRPPYCMRSCGRCASNSLARNPEESTFPEIDINGTLILNPTDDNADCTDEMNHRLKFSDSLNHTCFEMSNVGLCHLRELQPPYCMASCGRCDEIERGDNDDNNYLDDQKTVLFDQGRQCSFNKGILSSRFSDLSSSTRALDDFVVPAGQTWDITDVKVMGIWFGDFKGIFRVDVSIFHEGKMICRERTLVPNANKKTFSVPFTTQICRVIGARVDPENSTSFIPSDEKYYITVAPVLTFESKPEIDEGFTGEKGMYDLFQVHPIDGTQTGQSEGGIYDNLIEKTEQTEPRNHSDIGSGGMYDLFDVDGTDSRNETNEVYDNLFEKIDKNSTRERNMFFWSFSKTTNGDAFLWKDRSDLFGKGKCTTWTDGSTCGFPTSGSDLCFQIRGLALPTTSDDLSVFNTPQLSNDGDGTIGSDSDETRALSEEEKEARKEIAEYLYAISMKMASLLELETEMTSTIDGDLDSWAIPVVVVVGAASAAVALVSATLVAFHLRRGAELL